MLLLDFLFPKSCVSCGKWGRYLCDSCFSTVSFLHVQYCIECGMESVDGRTHKECKTTDSLDGVFSTVKNGKVIKRLLQVYTAPPYVKDVEKALFPFLYEGLLQNELLYSVLSTLCILVPHPLSSQEKRERGYSQHEELAKYLGRKFDKKVVNLLKVDRNSHISYIKTEINKQISIILVSDTLSIDTFKKTGELLNSEGFPNVWGITLIAESKKPTDVGS